MEGCEDEQKGTVVNCVEDSWKVKKFQDCWHFSWSKQRKWTSSPWAFTYGVIV